MELNVLVQVKLTVKKTLSVPVDAEVITPDAIASLSLSEVKSLNVWEGNRRRLLGELFNVEFIDSGEDDTLTLWMKGDLKSVRRIGSHMSFGRILIDGDVGMYLGEKMEGGMIQVNGNADSWLGSDMNAGLIEVLGDAGDFVGSPLRGLTRGMNGGRIHVKGSVGNECGCWMEDGTIIVDGEIGLFGGIHMRGGVILTQGNAMGRIGAGMIDGKIVIMGNIPSILPSFTFEEVRKSTRVGDDRVEGPFYLFSGDLAEDGKGRLYLAISENNHLHFIKKYMED
jgi:formylmethanofuran dehydrogenase subunit C